MEIFLKSVTERPYFYDGSRYLVETIWPEKVQDLDLSPYRWIREWVPSYELMQAVQEGRLPKEVFEYLYRTELEQPKAQCAIRNFIAEGHERVIFLYASFDPLESNAYYLKQYIDTCLELQSVHDVALAA